ncbi:MAG: flagellin [Methylophilaceae bacterium]
MAAVLGTNVASMFNVNALNKSKMALDTSLARLSSGSRINSAKDDATGLVSAIGFDSKLRGSLQAQRNANEGITKAQTNDSYVGQITENLQRLREIAVQLGGTATGTETTALVAENARIAGLVAATGAVVVDADGGTVTGVGTTYTAPVGVTVTAIDANLVTASTARAQFGADMATFQSASNNLGNSAVNIAAQLSAIMDTDYATESANMTKNNILQQAGTAALSQANNAPNNITQLLR